MQTIPLHPAIVHFPVALAVLAPFLALYLVVSLRRRRELPRAWTLIVIVLALTLAGGVAATRTGEAEEDRVEAFVGHGALEEHEEIAEFFVPVAATALLTALATPLVHGRPRLRAAAALVCLTATVALAGLTLRIGHSGGTLVYASGAAGAYAGAPPSTTVSLRTGDDGHE